MIQETLVLFSNIRNPNYTGSLQEYEAFGGYLGLKKALEYAARRDCRFSERIGYKRKRRSWFSYGLKMEFYGKK